jgi:ATP-dependent Clp protease ATP-binding subunit ClpA
VRRDSANDEASIIERIVSLGAADLTQRALAGQLAHAYGREAEVAKVFESMTARRSVLLLGNANIGKTAVLHEVISRIAHKQAPEALHGARIVSVSTGVVLVGTKYLGEWQTRFGELLEAIKSGKRIFLYIEDLWALRDAGRASDKSDGFSTFLRPFLERQDIVVLGESTPDNYSGAGYGTRALADDLSLMKLFNIITLEEPDRDATKAILASVARDLQRAHKVRIENIAIERALELTRRFLPYQAFPGKATHLLSEAARFRDDTSPDDKGKPQKQPQAGARDFIVTADLVSATFSRLTGLPEKIISDTIPLAQEEIHDYFNERVIGQEEAVNTVADVVTLVKAELNDPSRPLGVLFFVGPTGVGKTELAKTLAEYLFGSKDKLIRLDMSEYKTILSVPDLTAQLTEKQRRQSFSVLLLDEIEKASPPVFDLFLQVFDDARLTDSSGRSVDLRNTIIVMTSNIGTELSGNRGLGFLESSDRKDERRQQVMRAVEEYFRPEFINRLDKIVVFRPLGVDEMRRIARRELGKALLREGVLRRNILLDFREEVLDAIVRAGFSETYGARPLQRAIREEVLLPLARRIAAQPAAGEQLLELYVEDGHIDAAIIPVNPDLGPEPAEEERAIRDERLTIVDAASGRTRGMDLGQLRTAIVARREELDAHIAGERYQALKARSAVLLDEMNKPSFWDDNDRARLVMSAIYHIERVTERFSNLRNRAERLAEVAEMIRRNNDTAGIQRLTSSFEELERDAALAELELMAGATDVIATDALFLCITPVVTPLSQEPGDWPATLCEMYRSWAARKGHDVELVSEPDTAPMLLIRGPNLRGILAGEIGVHKLQRDDGEPRERSRARSLTQLARVDLLPIPPEDDIPFSREALEVTDIAEPRPREGKDRASQPAHTIEAQEPRSCQRVRVRCADAVGVARELIAARLIWEPPVPPHSEEVARVYRLAKTQYVRDPRTGHRERHPKDILAGAIDPFLLAYLSLQSQETPEPEPANVVAHHHDE